MIDTEFECWVDLNLAQGGYAGSQKTLLECESSQRVFARLPELRWSRETIFMPAYFFPEGQARVEQYILKTGQGRADIVSFLFYLPRMVYKVYSRQFCVVDRLSGNPANPVTERNHSQAGCTLHYLILSHLF